MRETILEEIGIKDPSVDKGRIEPFDKAAVPQVLSPEVVPPSPEAKRQNPEEEVLLHLLIVDVQGIVDEVDRVRLRVRLKQYQPAQVAVVMVEGPL
jgi:hypothetical protein